MMKTGKVKFYNSTKGFGFITETDGGDIFFHRSGLSNSNSEPEVGQEVEFETRMGDKGPMAVKIMASF